MKKPKLTEKQRAFCEEYLVDLNATQAAMRAKYSVKSAEQIGNENLGKPLINRHIAKLMEERSKRTQVTADMVVTEMARLAFSDMRSFVKWGPSGVNLLESGELDEDSARCVSMVSQTITKDGGSIKFQLHDKKGTLDSLARHLGMYVDKSTVDVNIKIIHSDMLRKALQDDDSSGVLGRLQSRTANVDHSHSSIPGSNGNGREISN